jgi:hypothetical protein
MSKQRHRLLVMPYCAQAVFALLWLAGIAAVVASGFSVDGYKLHVMQVPLPHPYPLTGVVNTSCVLTFELALIYAVIRPATFNRSWVRALGAVFVATIALLFSVATLMHAPPYWGAHGLFLCCLAVGLIVLLLATAVTRLHSRLR